ncbi:MAG TPA: DUF4156 domain-containing protein [Coxiellaceae bacterium]|nr:DUF4156 domain-containing protein [Coxiellaceae bacterium]
MNIDLRNLSLAIGLTLCACSSIPLEPQAQHVLVTPNPPSKKCYYLGQVLGNQGNFFTGGWTSNPNLEAGAMNDMKNKAAKLGANYVQIITSRQGNTGQNNGAYQQTNITDIGNAYKCPTKLVFK